MRLLLLQKPRNLETQRINVNRYMIFEVISTVVRIYFLSFYRYLEAKWFLTFMLNVKNCFNTKAEAFSSAYLLITEIYTSWSYGDGIAPPKTEKATAARWKSMFYVHYNFHAQDYCDDGWCIWVQHLSGFMSTL